MQRYQSPSRVILIEPVNFHANPQTLATNKHQKPDNSSHEVIQTKAQKEHQKLVAALNAHGIETKVFIGHEDTPDDLFCNNWVSFHQEGLHVLYPLLAENRRLERRLALCETFKEQYGNPIDFTHFEQSGCFLESTGSMVLDRMNRVAYAARSPRTHKDVFINWCDKMQYEAVDFDWLYPDQSSVYHTNVIMFIGSQVAGICLEGLSQKDKNKVQSQLNKTHNIIPLSFEQIEEFCGNALELRNQLNQLFLTMSSRAYHALTTTQRQSLEKYYDDIIHCDIPTIEQYGGGSVRCLILEQF